MTKSFFYSIICAFSICFSAFGNHPHSVSIEVSNIDVDQSFADKTYLGSDKKNLLTLGYGYKFQFNQAFIKPSIFYNIGDITINDTDGTNDKSTFNPSFSIEGDFGYDITNKFGVFGTVGFMQTTMEREVSGYKTDASYTGIITGAGVKYDIAKQLSIITKYQIAKFDYGIQGSSEKFNVETKAIRVGIAYNF